MKALVYKGPGEKALENRQKPKITAPTDAIVTITKTTICGTDLHILKGDVPSCQPGAVFWVTKVLALLTRLGQVSPHSSRETEC